MSSIWELGTTEESSIVRKSDEGGVFERVTLVFYHEKGAETAHLTAGHPITVGRAAPCDVVIPHTSISRKHARFTLSEEGIAVEDLGSTNGIKVNGKITDRATVTTSDEIGLGSITAFIHMLRPKDVGVDGILTHDRFEQTLEDEVLRAKSFERPLSVLMIRSVRAFGDMSTFHARIREALRTVDRLSAYAPDAVEIMLPEVDRSRAAEIATRIVTPRSGNEALLLAGVATFGPLADSAEALISLSRRAVRAAQPDDPVQIAGINDDPPTTSREPVVLNEEMKKVHAVADRVARSRIPVLICGETGTGKEVIALRIHERGPNKAGPMRSVNCGAIPMTLIESVLFGYERGAFSGAEQRTAGIFEDADGGTVFLDEIGELPSAAQVALLRVLETKRLTRLGGTREIEINVRILAATHRDLEALVLDGRFRADLLYRLNTMTIEVLPLRRRVDEIEPLALLFMHEANRVNGTAVKSIDPAVLELLRHYRWPGNVRELRNVIERACVIATGDTITVVDLSDRIRGVVPPRAARPETATADPKDSLDFRESVHAYEKQIIIDALNRSNGNQCGAARALNLPVRTLAHKMNAFGITAKKSQPR